MRRRVKGPKNVPNTWVIETWPSLACHTMRICRPAEVHAAAGPARQRGAVPARPGSGAPLRIVATCCAATSTCWPRPDAARSCRASSAPAGGRGGGVAPDLGHADPQRRAVGVTGQDQAARRGVEGQVVAAQCALGPSWPNGVTDTTTRAGLRAARSS